MQILLRNLLLALAYFVAARLGLLLAVPPGYATTVWSPSGIALGAVLVGGYPLLPGVWLGSFAANLPNGFDASGALALLRSLAIPAGIGCGAVLQAAATVWIIRRWVGYSSALVEDRDIGRFFLLAGPLGSLVNASLSVPLLTLAGRVSPEEAGGNWFIWWTGDTLGGMIFAPLLLMLFGQPREVWRYRLRSISLPLLVSFVLVAGLFIHERSNLTQGTVGYVLAGGTALVGMLSGFLLTLTGRTLRVEELVRERTSALVAKNRLLHEESAQRRAAEASLNASIARIQAIVDSEPACLKVLAPDGTLLEMNPAGLAQIEAESAEDVIGRYVFDLIAPEHRDAYRHFHERVCAGQSGVLQFEIVGLKGGRHWMETHAAPLREGDVPPWKHLAVTLDITPFKEHQQYIEHLAYYDTLTQLPNRVLLADRLQLALTQTRRAGDLLAVGYLDLDDFKPVNDTYGHKAGDALLLEVAGRIRDSLRAGDTVARLGGDEFALLLVGLESAEECRLTLARLLERLAAPFTVEGHEVKVSASIGVTLFPLDEVSPDILLRHADQAMYQAKQTGRNSYHFFDAESDRQARIHREALERIQAALPGGEFVLYYQPIVDMRRGQTIRVEALIRWQHPERGLVPPGEFIPLIEATNFVAVLGEWVIAQALRQTREWKAQGLELPVSVNISARHLMQPTFCQRLSELLAQYPETAPRLLELEILETAAFDDLFRVNQVMEECRKRGVSFALDDFGTGYSSLTFLRRLSADVLKIDQSFVRDMLDDPEDLAIVSGIIGLSRAFLRHVIAEGVETPEHGALLLKMGCDLAQGYGIARPMPAEDLPGWVAAFIPDPTWTAERNI